jgi:3-O-methylgallate 3,4-dioxygenase
MAEIVLGLGSSHAPQLEMPGNTWREYGDIGRKQAQHWFAGNTYSFGELAELRMGERIEKELNEETFATRFAACQTAIAHLSATLEKAKVDVAVILGDDQMESFNDENMPSFCIYYGDSLDDAPHSTGFRATFSDPAVANAPADRVTHLVQADLGEHVVKSMIANEFDVARSSKLPLGRGGDGTIGHAFYYAYRRLMNNDVIPNVPVMVNTYYPPNAPTAVRCYKFGKALAQAIKDWDSDARVAIIASGGLSHTVIEEELDSRILEGLKHDDLMKLTDYPDERFRGGTSEIKNWIALGGVMSDVGIGMSLVDYVPCYRTEAGNGCAMGFAEWV